MIQQLRALSALAEDPDSVPSTRHAHTVYILCRQTLTHINKK